MICNRKISLLQVQFVQLRVQLGIYSRFHPLVKISTPNALPQQLEENKSETGRFFTALPCVICGNLSSIYDYPPLFLECAAEKVGWLSKSTVNREQCITEGLSKWCNCKRANGGRSEIRVQEVYSYCPLFSHKNSIVTTQGSH